MNSSDASLLERWNIYRDAEAFAELVTRHSAMVYNACRRVLGNPHDAEDVAQECFAELVRNPPKKREDCASLGGWLYTVATRRAINKLRAGARRQAYEQPLSGNTHDAAHTEPTEYDDVQSMVDEIIVELPGKLREPLIAHFLEGQSHQLVAEAMGIPRRTVTSRIAKALDEVRAGLKKRGVPISTSALAALLTVEAAQAVPATLTAALGTIAITAGHSVTGAAAATQAVTITSQLVTIGGIVMSTKKIVVIVAAVAALVTGGYVAKQLSTQTSEPSSSVALSTTANSPQTANPNQTNAVMASLPVVQDASLAPDTEPDDDTKRPLKGNGIITGTVVHALSNQLIGGATVTVELSDWNPFDVPPDKICHKTAITADDGTFEVKGLPVLPGPVVFGVVVDKGNLSGIAPNGVMLTRAKPKEDVTIQVVPAHRITGTVRAKDGTPVENADVQVSKIGEQAMTLPHAVIGVLRATSDAEGKFTLRHFSPVQVGLRVVSADYAMQDFGPFAIDAANIELVLEPGMAVSGKVLVKGTGTPVADGTLKLTHSETGVGYDAKTGEDGTFLFKSVAPGRFTEHLQDERYVLADPDATLAVSPGTDIDDLIIYATEGATISGRIYDEDTNKGIAGANVRFSCSFGEKISTTDEDGYYSQAGVPIGTVTVTPTEANGYPPPEWRMRRQLAVTPGQSIENLDFALRKGLSISGIILDPDNRAAPNVGVYTQSNNGGNYGEALSDKNGRFEILGVLPTTGLYVHAEVDGYGCPPAGPFDLIDESISDVTLQLAEASTIEGVVVDPDGNPVPNAGVYIQSPATRVVKTTRADAQGQFKVKDLYAGRHILYPNPPGQNILRLDQPHPVGVGEGEHLTGVELTLNGTNGLSISGRVLDSKRKPIRWAAVQARDGNGHYEGDECDQSGTYLLDGLSEADYTLTANGASHYDSEPVTVPAGSENVDFVLLPAGCVKGQVVDARTSQPIQQFELYGTRGLRRFETWMLRNFRPMADAEGRFSYEEITQSQYTLFFRVSGYATTALPISDVGPGETLNGVIVKLEQTNPVEGVVQTDQGEPVSGARIFIGDVPYSYQRNYGEAALSRSNGSFTIDSLPADTVTISACHPAYARGSGTISSNGSVTIVLTEGGVIQGRVTEGGKPVEGAQISASYINDHNQQLTQGNENSDANGEYMITGLQPRGNYRVSASLQGQRRNRSQESVVVAAGMATDVNFDFPLADASIEGRVTIDGQPPSGGRRQVSAETVIDGETESASSQIDANGYYRIEAIPAGVVLIQASAQDQDGQQRTRSLQTETYSGQTTILDIELSGNTNVAEKVASPPTD